MTSYTVYFTTTASSYVEVDEAEVNALMDDGGFSRDDAVIEAAYQKFHDPRPCAQCSEWGSRDSGFELAGDWEADSDIQTND